MEDWMKQDKLSDVPFWFSRAETEQTEDLDTWLCVFFFFFLNAFSRRVPGKRRKRSRRVKAAARASISPSANTTASPVERWAQMERDRKSGHCLMWCSNEGIMGREVKGTSENVRQLTVNNRAASEHSLSFSLGVLLQAICAKCSKTLDNKTSRVCPECYEAILSLENLGISEQKRKAAPEVRRTINKNTNTLRSNMCILVYISALICASPVWSKSHSVPKFNVMHSLAARLHCGQQTDRKKHSGELTESSTSALLDTKFTTVLSKHTLNTCAFMN